MSTSSHSIKCYHPLYFISQAINPLYHTCKSIFHPYSPCVFDVLSVITFHFSSFVTHNLSPLYHHHQQFSSVQGNGTAPPTALNHSLLSTSPHPIFDFVCTMPLTSPVPSSSPIFPSPWSSSFPSHLSMALTWLMKVLFCNQI